MSFFLSFLKFQFFHLFWLCSSTSFSFINFSSLSSSFSFRSILYIIHFYIYSTIFFQLFLLGFLRCTQVDPNAVLGTHWYLTLETKIKISLLANTALSQATGCIRPSGNPSIHNFTAEIILFKNCEFGELSPIASA